MKTWELGEQGSVDTLRLHERPDPSPGSGEAVVRFHASSLNYRDHMIINLIASERKPAERIPVSDGAGEVIAVGDGVDAVKPGDRVMVSFFTDWLDGPLEERYFGSDLGGGRDGVLTELGAFPASSLVPIPEGMGYEEAATLPVAALTAWAVIVELGKVKAGDTVLMLGTGGVSIFGVQLAKMMGARAVITSSSDEKLERAKALGADHGINYATTPAWGEAVHTLTGGADIIIETGGASTLGQSMEAASQNARIGLIGMLGGVDQTIDPLGLLFKTLHLAGVFVASRRSFVEMNKAIGANGIEPVIDSVFPFDEAQAAYRRLGRGAFGKVVIKHI